MKSLTARHNNWHTVTYLPEHDGRTSYYMVRKANFSPGTLQHLPSLLPVVPLKCQAAASWVLTEMEDLTLWMAGSSWHIILQYCRWKYTQVLPHLLPIITLQHPSIIFFFFVFLTSHHKPSSDVSLISQMISWLTCCLQEGKLSCRLAAPSREYRCLVAAGGRKSEPKSLSPSPPPLSILCVKSLTASPSYLLQQCQAKWKG